MASCSVDYTANPHKSWELFPSSCFFMGLALPSHPGRRHRAHCLAISGVNQATSNSPQTTMTVNSHCQKEGATSGAKSGLRWRILRKRFKLRSHAKANWQFLSNLSSFSTLPVFSCKDVLWFCRNCVSLLLCVPKVGGVSDLKSLFGTFQLFVTHQSLTESTGLETIELGVAYLAPRLGQCLCCQSP